MRLSNRRCALLLVLVVFAVTATRPAGSAVAAQGPVEMTVGPAVTDFVAGVARDVIAPEPTFPVHGPFNWGQGEAAYHAGRSGHAHEGQDVFARIGTPIVSASAGAVVDAGNDGGRGNFVAIHDAVARRTYVYMHMNAPARVRDGALVTRGQRIGEVGCTGSCSGAHLHFEIRHGGSDQAPSSNPLPALVKWAADSGARATLAPGAS